MKTSTVLALAAATASAQQCSTNWSQCNGQNWPTSSVCCQDRGFQCNFKNQYLSLCEPKPTKAAEDSESHVWTIARWAQCGGKGFVTNNGVCSSDDKCQPWNEWYFQCIPKGQKTKDVEEAESHVWTIPRFGQCGGKGFVTNNGVCSSDDKCQPWNEWYHQCVPK
ncbi:Aste57867_23921 [Aphanomyces stellatus]|uniref:Aste57867_23921 protein n=1 Tax=Aphanomyces stellatus TaxID=120398 RepID=A0A485LNW6_9STRA|nr:hypothetical protein As57867_023848 [Aphanomyces stellatus]KAF0705963.1 hypothetical protein As57867_006849 [Aphanomyces stellatus]VFT83827.1 Aste57867_6870 [Aphanomyces stellatus]VFU00564.1 Aste57867_23921 [Aphanomyces stellatus]